MMPQQFADENLKGHVASSLVLWSPDPKYKQLDCSAGETTGKGLRIRSEGERARCPLQDATHVSKTILDPPDQPHQ